MADVVLVTGGCGFIGTWVVKELLDRGAQPIVVDHQSAPDRWRRVLGDRAAQVPVLNISLLDRDAIQATLERHAVTHLIHLAAVLTPACQQDPWLGCQINILGSTAVFDAARRAGSINTVAYASSYAVYGPETGADAVATNRPPSFYGAFKQSVDLIAEQYWRHFGLASVAVRPHVVYGPEREIGLTAGPSLACKAVACGERYQIGYSGRVGYDYVTDVAAAFVRAAFEVREGASVVDLPGEQLTSEEFVAHLTALEPTTKELIIVQGPTIPANIPPHMRDIRELFPEWRPTSIQEGIRQTVEFYRRQQEGT